MDTAVNVPLDLESVQKGANKLIDNIRSVIYIDRIKLEYMIAAQIAAGHVMLADSHGVGKTSLARALAGSIDWKERDVSSEGIEVVPFSRIQCTVDLLPQDILLKSIRSRPHHYRPARLEAGLYHRPHGYK